MFSPVPWPERKEFRTAGDEVFAPINRGPHRGGPLAEGIVAGRKVACPLHNWGIDLHGPDAFAFYLSGQ